MLQLETRPATPRSFISSVIVHVILIALLLAVRSAPDAPAATRIWHVAMLAPPSRTLPSPITKIQPPPRARVFHPVFPAPRRVESKIALEAPPAIALPRPVLPVPETPRIATATPEIKTGNLAEVDAPPAAASPQIAIQPAGFSSSEASAPPHPRSAPASTGAFDSAQSARAISPRLVPHAGGFSEIAAVAPEPVQRSLVNAAFGDTAVAARVDPARVQAQTTLTSPVEIQFKPRPVYTAEARSLQIEGEVQLEIVFEASGKLKILRVVRALGYGLDESAMEAARGIRFSPAQLEGRAIDSTAVVHIVFQLAY